MPLFDTHFHVDSDSDPMTVLSRAREAGVTRLVAVASDLAEAQRLHELYDGQPDVCTTVGLHPHEATRFDGDISGYEELTHANGVCAVGEIGLDYHYDHSPRDVQRQVFTQFLQLAGRREMPSIIHCRDAYDDCLQILRATVTLHQKLLIHSYTGTAEWAVELLKMGAFFSFNGIITFRAAENVREALRAVPIERILLETDSPYLAPVPHRGKRNEPAFLVQVALCVAEEKGLTFDEVAEITTHNACEFFGVD